MSVIIQHVYTSPTATEHASDMADMMRLTYQRHAAYAKAFKFDYWHILGEWHKEMPIEAGGWAKIWLIKEALEQGHDFVAWIDADAAIVDFETDLRNALTYGQIGAVFHDAPWFKEPMWQIPPHYNVGVLYARPGALPFLNDWLAKYPAPGRWMEQGAFNEMIASGKYAGIFEPIAAWWNATYNVNEVEKPIVRGWHGIFPMAQRAAMMKSLFSTDHLVYKVV